MVLTVFDSVEHLTSALEGVGYLAERSLVTTLYLAYKLQKPLLLEGPPGVGKTALAQVVAQLLGHEEPIRLQCYEGLSFEHLLYDWDYKKQLLYIESLRQQVDWDQLEDNIYSERFLSPRPLLKAILAPTPQVLLIDELDKAEEELEAMLLEFLSVYQVSIPELGTFHAQSKPLVILTSNHQRELSDATRRRCLYYYIDYPSLEQELRIVRSSVPGLDTLLATQLVAFIHALRREQLRKHPSLSETLDWARVLVILGAEGLKRELVEETLNVILKKQEDLERIRGMLPHLMTKLPTKPIDVKLPDLSRTGQLKPDLEENQWDF